MKRCSNCRVEKPADDYYRSSKAHDGLQGYCKVCSAEKRLAFQRANRARMREHHKKWVGKNREKVRDYFREWQRANPEKVGVYVKRWQAKNPEIVHAMQAKRRDAPVGTPFSRAGIIERDGSRCHLCGKKCKPREIHIDHLIPVAHGGAHAAENVAVACATCNLRRGAGRIAAQLRLI